MGGSLAKNKAAARKSSTDYYKHAQSVTCNKVDFAGLNTASFKILVVVAARERGQSCNEGEDPDHDEIMMDAQAWKRDIMDNLPGSRRDIPMVIFINKKDSKAAANAGSRQDHSDLGHQGGMAREQLVDLTTNNGFRMCLEIHPHLGDESVLRAVDSLLRLLMEKRSIDQSLSTDLAYPSHTQYQQM